MYEKKKVSTSKSCHTYGEYTTSTSSLALQNHEMFVVNPSQVSNQHKIAQPHIRKPKIMQSTRRIFHIISVLVNGIQHVYHLCDTLSSYMLYCVYHIWICSVTRLNMFCHTVEHVLSHVWTCGLCRSAQWSTPKCRSFMCTGERGMSHVYTLISPIWMSHGTRMNESWHSLTHERVKSYVWVINVIHMDK